MYRKFKYSSHSSIWASPPQVYFSINKQNNLEFRLKSKTGIQLICPQSNKNVFMNSFKHKLHAEVYFTHFAL